MLLAVQSDTRKIAQKNALEHTFRDENLKKSGEGVLHTLFFFGGGAEKPRLCPNCVHPTVLGLTTTDVRPKLSKSAYLEAKVLASASASQ